MGRLGLGLGVPARRAVAAAGGGEPEQFITNGAFAADTDWTKGAGWTISAGAASSDGSVGQLSQNFGALVAPLTNGNGYTLSYTLTNANGGMVTATLSGGAGSQAFSTSSAGAISHPVTATDARTTISFQSIDAEPIAVDNVSLVPA